MTKARQEVEHTRCCSISDEGRTAGGCGVGVGSVLGLKLREHFWLEMEAWESHCTPSELPNCPGMTETGVHPRPAAHLISYP